MGGCIITGKWISVGGDKWTFEVTAKLILLANRLYFIFFHMDILSLKKCKQNKVKIPSFSPLYIILPRGNYDYHVGIFVPEKIKLTCFFSPQFHTIYSFLTTSFLNLTCFYYYYYLTLFYREFLKLPTHLYFLKQTMLMFK